jgi:hypothetical protein
VISVSKKVSLDPKMADLIAGLKRVDSVVKETAWDKTLAVSLKMEQEIKDEMPVDTGRAKASWGHFTPQDLVKGSARIGHGKRITKRTRFQTAEGVTSGRAQIATAGDAIWEEDPSRMMVVQGTNVPYVPFLNDGTSRMPALGFIDRAFERAQTAMESFGEALGTLITDVLGSRSDISGRP